MNMTRHEEAAQRREETTNALKRGFVWINGVTWLYRLGALAYAVVTLFAILALARNDVPRGAGTLVVALTAFLAVSLLMGALHILFKPFVWTCIIATLATVVTLIHLFGPNPLGLAFPASALLAVLLWAALVPTLRFRKLIAEHKATYILHNASLSTRRSLKGRSPEQKYERLIGAMNRAARRAWKLSTVAAVGIALASTVGVYAALDMRPPLFPPTLEGFEQAWNQGDLEAVSAFFDSKVRSHETSWLAGVIEGHGWTDELPRLEGGTTHPSDGGVTVEYELEGSPLSSSWQEQDKSWCLVRIELPVPPLEPVLESFKEAWHSSDPQAIARFFSPKNREEMLDSIERARVGRGWAEFPQLGKTKMGDYSGGHSEVFFSLARGRLRTRWQQRDDGTWGLQGMKLPRRR